VKGGEDTNDRERVGDAAARHPNDGLVEGHAVDLEVSFLVLGLVLLGGIGELTCQVYPHGLVRHARGRVGVDEQVPAGRDQAGLLGQLPACCLDRRLVRDVEQPRRQLPQRLPYRVAVLLEQDDALLLIERDDADRARVVDDLADLGAATGHRHLVPAEGEDRPLVDGLAALDLVVVRHRGSLSRAGGETVSYRPAPLSRSALRW